MTIDQIKELASKGDVEAKYIYSILLIDGFYEGLVCEKNIEEGGKILYDLGEEGYTQCICMYAEFLKKYNSLSSAVEYLREKINQFKDDQTVRCTFGLYLIYDKQEQQGVEILQSLDKHPMAWYFLSEYYFKIMEHHLKEGYFEKIDYKSLELGRYYLQKCFDAGILGANYIYGCCYLFGIFGITDHNKAYENISIDAAKGFGPARNLIKHFKKKFLKGWVYE